MCSQISDVACAVSREQMQAVPNERLPAHGLEAEAADPSEGVVFFISHLI